MGSGRGEGFGPPPVVYRGVSPGRQGRSGRRSGTRRERPTLVFAHSSKSEDRGGRKGRTGREEGGRDGVHGPAGEPGGKGPRKGTRGISVLKRRTPTEYWEISSLKKEGVRKVRGARRFIVLGLTGFN